MSRKKIMVLFSAVSIGLLAFNAVAAGRNDFALYECYIKEAVASAGLPEKVAYMPLVLTDGDPAYREGSAAGLWSVTAPIARHYGVAVSDGFDGRYDVEYCTAAALAYFSELYRRSGGDLNAAMSQYAIASGQSSKAASFADLLVVACTKYEAVLNGTAPQLVPVRLESAVLLTELCRALDVSASSLNADNPAIIPDGKYLPANAVLRLPEAKSALFGQVSGKLYASAESDLRKVEMPYEKQSGTESETAVPGNGNNQKKAVTYRIKSGDTLGGIALRHHVTVSQLKRWNNLKSNNIRAGKTLKIYK